MKKINCPLCGAKDVIVYTDPIIVTHTIPAPRGTIGNYRRIPEGGGYDWSHAETCSKLKNVTHKEQLLEYFVQEGDPSMLYSDLLFYKQYQMLLKKVKYELRIEPFQKEKEFKSLMEDPFEWRIRMYIAPLSRSKKRYLETEAKDIDTAFSRIKHRLLCGEVLQITKTKGLQYKDKSFVFIK